MNYCSKTNTKRLRCCLKKKKMTGQKMLFFNNVNLKQERAQWVYIKSIHFIQSGNPILNVITFCHLQRARVARSRLVTDSPDCSQLQYGCISYNYILPLYARYFKCRVPDLYALRSALYIQLALIPCLLQNDGTERFTRGSVA